MFKITMETFNNDEVKKDYCVKCMRVLKSRGYVKSPVRIETLIDCYENNVSIEEALQNYQGRD